MRLRQAVFVVEQNCPYGDLDGIDQQCLHLSGWHEQKPIAYLRIVPPTIHDSGCPSIGRICTSTAARRYGAGRELVKRGLEIVDQRYPGMPCQIGAQSYLRKFYESFGFIVNGDHTTKMASRISQMRRPAAKLKINKINTLGSARCIY